MKVTAKPNKTNDGYIIYWCKNRPSETTNFCEVALMSLFTLKFVK